MWPAAEGQGQVVKELIRSGGSIPYPFGPGVYPSDVRREGGPYFGCRGSARGRSGCEGDRAGRGRAQARLRRGAAPAGAGALLLAITNAHFELAGSSAGRRRRSECLPAGSHTLALAIVPVRKPGVGDNDLAP